MDKECAMSHYNLASAYHSINQVDSAKKYFLKAIELRPAKADDSFDPADAYFNLGICYQVQPALQCPPPTAPCTVIKGRGKCLPRVFGVARTRQVRWMTTIRSNLSSRVRPSATMRWPWSKTQVRICCL